MKRNKVRGATLGERLLNLRQDAGLTQEQVASRMAITNGAVSHWENGGWKPTTVRLVALSKLYGVSLDDLLAGAGDQVAQ